MHISFVDTMSGPLGKSSYQQAVGREVDFKAPKIRFSNRPSVLKGRSRDHQEILSMVWGMVLNEGMSAVWRQGV